MQDQPQRLAGFDVRGLRRPPETEPEHRYHQFRESQLVDHRLRIVSDPADVDPAEPHGLGGEQQVLGHQGGVHHGGHAMLGPAFQSAHTARVASQVDPPQISAND